jgi:protein O-mannosyl-transferase
MQRIKHAIAEVGSKTLYRTAKPVFAPGIRAAENREPSQLNSVVCPSNRLSFWGRQAGKRCMGKARQIVLVCVLLAIGTFVAFWPVTRCEFTNYDDPDYVTRNIHVQAGVTLAGVRWAFVTSHASNWHPLTWISHMLDVQLFGLDPRWHHLVSLLLHVLTALLLFLVLLFMTDALWQSAFVAALFALHPLHVESVAWVAERKDVLCAFFWMLTLGAYVRYVRRPGFARYLTVLLTLGLGLMAKPMLVTLPFVLLLLDYWPLRRFTMRGPSDKPKRTPKCGVAKPSTPGQWALVRPLLLEKAPFFVLSALSSVITYSFQQKEGAVASIDAFRLSARFGNAIVSYATYLEKTLWPAHLAVFYPHPGYWPLWKVVGAVLFLTGVTCVVLRWAARFPYLAVGWLWYLGTLVPVIGIVQVGVQAMADRYTYIPLIGVFIMAAWGIPELVKRWRFHREALAAASVSSLACLCLLTWIQVGYWQTSITLYDRALAVTDRNSIAYNNRGIAYDRVGNQSSAITDYDHAIEINPRYAEAYYNRGIAYRTLGDPARAIEDFTRAIEIDPHYAEAYINRGVARNRLGSYQQAIADYDKAIGLNPRYAEAYYNRGIANGSLGNPMQAIEDLTRAIAIDPKHAEAYNSRGVANTALARDTQAIEDFDRAIQINPRYAAAYYNRGFAYGRLGNEALAIENLRAAARLGDQDASVFLRSQGITW